MTPIPEPLRRELVNELTAATQLAGSDPDAARPRVADADIALGNSAAEHDVRLASTMRALLWHRRPDATICPSDAARVVGGESWRDLMEAAREVAAALAREGTIVVRQRGEDVDVTTAVGPIRLARGPQW